MKHHFLTNPANKIDHYKIDYDILPSLGGGGSKSSNYKSLANYRDKKYLKPSGTVFFTPEVLNPFELQIKEKIK